MVGCDLYYGRQRPVPLCHLGNRGADWSLYIDPLGASSVVYSCGVGTDISFEIGLTELTGAVVHAFDPTPRAMQWLATQTVPENFVFHAFGVAAFDGTATFAPPDNPAHVSFTMLPREGGDQIVAPVYQLSTIAKQLGHDRIDLLKMDIEGAEYEVLQDCLANGPPIRQLLVEFHHRWADVPLERTREAIRLLNTNNFKLINVSPTGTEYAFLHD